MKHKTKYVECILRDMKRQKTPKSPKNKSGLKSSINEVLAFIASDKSVGWDSWSKKIKKIKWAEFGDKEYQQAKNELVELIQIMYNHNAQLGHQLEKLQFQLHSEEKFWRESDETKADFLSLVSHQLRTPLTVSLLNVEILLASYHGDLVKEQKKSLQEIFLSLRRMAEMLNVFSIVSKIELNTFILKPKPLDLTEVLRDLLTAKLAENKSTKLKVETDYDTQSGIVRADFDLINIALSNLVSFSVKNALECKNGKVKVITCGDDLGVFICFYNNGPVIPEIDQGKIFSKGYRTNNSNKEDLSDVGLGFYISKTIIDRSGGRIWFESSLEKGTSFHVFLPKANGQST